MEYGTIEREIHVEAPIETVFEVVTQPEHISQWWSDEAELDVVVGGAGELLFGDRGTGHVALLTVVEVDPPRRFAFRWCAPDGASAVDGNSLLVTFDLVATGSGTTVRVTDAGWDEVDWEPDAIADAHQDHSQGWTHFVPLLETYVNKLVAS